MFTDTHAHVYVEEFGNDLSEVLKRAGEAGVDHIFMPNIDSGSIPALHKVEADYTFCTAMMGLHPCHVGENFNEELKIVKEWLFGRRYAAVGEIGIDLYWDKTFVHEQEMAFRQQTEWALELNLPIVIHSRESLDMTISIVSEYVAKGISGVFHCFTGTREQAFKIVDMGFFLGIGGVVTYKNSHLGEVLEDIPMKNIVLETDSPYLPPVPYRGKRNEPSFIIEVAKKLSLIKKMEISEIGSITTNNAKNLFRHTSELIDKSSSEKRN
ncbi:MAG: TatD family hydrolase [Saprospiraceae bacterium]|nr:TatD family hydrolase [Saprospiraceae bacterium]MBK6564203.1 TatD family hydrolase [Saprospiraceae bacterium]MBK7524117.1 TatD family hydrolase [Saprospiraceae bacterium]MBK8372169.1 TatD family hydrolase [Saprospiraceae bacterium]MBK8547436.1 TatD family hydrolase [Saprospiraceae bacterium]